MRPNQPIRKVGDPVSDVKETVAESAVEAEPEVVAPPEVTPEEVVPVDPVAEEKAMLSAAKTAYERAKDDLDARSAIMGDGPSRILQQQADLAKLIESLAAEKQKLTAAGLAFLKAIE